MNNGLITWEMKYDCAKSYYNYYGNLNVPRSFRTNDGISYQPDGKISLGSWVAYQRKNVDPNSERGKMLLDIGMDFNVVNDILKEERWKTGYNYAKAYFEQYGNLKTSFYYKNSDGFNLGYWVYMQRKRIDPNSERGKMLSDIGMEFLIHDKKLIIDNWNKMYNYAKKYYEHYGNLNVPTKFKTNDGINYDPEGKINLGHWIALQRYNEKLDQERYRLLLNIGMSYENQSRVISEKKWNENYECAKRYYKHYGDLEVPKVFRTNDGYTYDENGRFDLNTWVARQKLCFDPESERGKKLLAIGLNFSSKKEVTEYWEKMYSYAKKYYEHYGNLNVPRNFKTNDGINYDPEGNILLGGWLLRQRLYTPVDSERGKKLLAIGVSFENGNIMRFNRYWEKMYSYAEKYYKHYGNLNVPRNFKTNDGINYDPEGEITLGNWLLRQRLAKDLSSERRQRLLDLNLYMGNLHTKYFDSVWNNMYEYAKKYYEHYGNLNIPVDFKTNDGINYDPNGKVALGSWLLYQRQNVNPESERGKKLLENGMSFKQNFGMSERYWNNMYECAKKYYQYYGNLDVPANFRTNDGINYQEDGSITLGSWIETQKSYAKPDSDKGKKLLEIGLIFNLKDDKRKKLDICYKYGIIYTKRNARIIKRISSIELQAKIDYMIGKGMSIVDQNNDLHEIFSMSNVDLIDKYGIDLVELTKERYKKRIRE